MVFFVVIAVTWVSAQRLQVDANSGFQVESAQKNSGPNVGINSIEDVAQLMADLEYVDQFMKKKKMHLKRIVKQEDKHKKKKAKKEKAGKSEGPDCQHEADMVALGKKEKMSRECYQQILDAQVTAIKSKDREGITHQGVVERTYTYPQMQPRNMVVIKMRRTAGTSYCGVMRRAMDAHDWNHTRDAPEWIEYATEAERKAIFANTASRREMQRVFRNVLPHAFYTTIVREPLTRCIADAFHRGSIRGMRVCTQTKGTCDHVLMQEYINKSCVNFMTRHAATRSFMPPSPGEDPPANLLTSYYDFVAVTERFDESMVVLKKILGLEFTDILYTIARSDSALSRDRISNGYDYMSHSYKDLDPNMQRWAYTQMNSKRNYDMQFYLDALAELDNWITAYPGGRPAFEADLSKYRSMLKIAQMECQHFADESKARLGTDGYLKVDNKKVGHAPDCLWNDYGCGDQCMDDVAKKHGWMTGEEEALGAGSMAVNPIRRSSWFR